MGKHVEAIDEGEEDDNEIIISWIQERLHASGLDESLWTPTLSEAAIDWLGRPSNDPFFVWYSKRSKSLRTSSSLPKSGDDAISSITYFINLEKSKITPSTISNSICYGTISLGLDSKSCQQLFTKVYSPTILDSTSAWSQPSKNELIQSYHNCMAAFGNKSEDGMLYLSKEDFCLTKNDTSGDGRADEVSSRLETIATNWVAKMDEMLQHKNSRKTCGDVAELVRYWGSRSSEMEIVLSQLNDECVQSILHSLTKYSPLSLQQITLHRKEIERELDVATDIVKSLEDVSIACETLANAKKPRDIDAQVPELFEKVKKIATDSNFFHSKSQISCLLRNVTWSVVGAFRKIISWDGVCNGDVDENIHILHSIVDGAVEYRRELEKASKSFLDETSGVDDTSNSPNLLEIWDFDAQERDVICSPLEYFIGRCNDCLDICIGRKQFSEARQLHGLRGKHYDMLRQSMECIERDFSTSLLTLQTLSYSPFDVVSSDNFVIDFGAFKKVLGAADAILITSIESAFHLTPRIDDATKFLDHLFGLACRDAIKKCIQQRAISIHKQFSYHCNSVRAEFEDNKRCPPLQMDEPPFAGRAMWAKSLLSKVDCDRVVISESTALKAYPSNETKEFESLEAVISAYHVKQNEEWQGFIQDLGQNEIKNILDQPLLTGGGYYYTSEFPSSIKLVLRESHYWEKHSTEDLPNHVTSIIQREEDLRTTNERVAAMVRQHTDLLDALNESPSHIRIFSDSLKALDKLIRPGRKMAWSTRPYLVDKYVTSVLPLKNSDGK